MSTTTNLGLNKHDNPSTNTDAFDIENYMNVNWDAIDDFAGTANTSIETNTTHVANREHLHTLYRQDITEDISADTTITLPCEYIVGDNLVVSYCGERLIKGTHYSEVGTTGKTSTTITILFNITYSEDFDKYFDFLIKEADSDE